MVQSPTLVELFPKLRLPSSVAGTCISGIALDSRRVKPGDLFLALPGGSDDGRAYIRDAIINGAAAVAVESTAEQAAGSVTVEQGVPVISAAKLSAQASAIAGNFYGNPSRHLQVVGVTGTNGKSTTVSLIAQLCKLLKTSAASIGTLGVVLNGKLLDDTGMTTPDAVTCQKWLAELLAQGVKVVAMEVSSHGLDQDRVSAVRFASGVFTNISHDHLDYHGSIQRYALAKQRLFRSMGLGSAVINLDDPFASQMRQPAEKSANVIGYSLLRADADVYAADVQYSSQGAQFDLRTPWGRAEVASPLLGEFNVYNLLAAVAVLCDRGLDLGQVTQCIPQLQPVAGRMQTITCPAGITAVVDYAHTPDALAQSIAATRVHTSGRLWVIFGCGGDRDRSKRPVMAKIAEQFADLVVVTSDNPRSEDPLAIIAEIEAGFTSGNHTVEPDRQIAIASAIERAMPGDVLLIAGKGHEKYQIVGREKHFFDDVAVAEACLAKRQCNTVWGESSCD